MFSGDFLKSALKILILLAYFLKAKAFISLFVLIAVIKVLAKSESILQNKKQDLWNKKPWDLSFTVFLFFCGELHKTKHWSIGRALAEKIFLKILG